MMQTIIPAFISAAAAILVCVLNNRFQNRKDCVRQEKTISIIECKIDELSRRVEKHNNVIERTCTLEGQMREVQHEIRDLKGR